MDENAKKMLELLNPEVFKTNLLLSSIFIAYFENSIDYIIDQPKSFFCNGFDSEKGEIIDPDYKSKVLNLDKKPINASLLWFKEQGAIDDADIETFEILRKYRNKLSHELTKILLDEGLESSLYTENLAKLFSLRIKLEKWWFFYFEIEFTDIKNADLLEEKDVTTGGEMIYRLFMDLLSDDNEKANYYVNELKKRMAN
ncbi:MAG: hypothetical protein AB7S72_16250 [Draconibacterium sp.]